jgi:hypothetical protein
LDLLKYEEKNDIQYFVKYYNLKGELDRHSSAKIDEIKHSTKPMNELTRRGYNPNYILSES